MYAMSRVDCSRVGKCTEWVIVDWSRVWLGWR